MDTDTQLRELVASLLIVPVADVVPDTPLAALQTSLGDAKLHIGVKRLGLTLPAGAAPSTFRELSQAVQGDTAVGEDRTAPRRVAESAPTPDLQGRDVRIGIDIETIGQFPESSDYWEDAFVAEHFGSTEIAYAVIQANPRTHLAGFWCAKEALRKCDPSFLATAFVDTVVEHEADGRPFLVLTGSSGRTRLPHTVSLSHTDEVATAVVMITPAPRPSAPVGDREADALGARLPVEPNGFWRLLSGLALVVALVALALVVARDYVPH